MVSVSEKDRLYLVAPVTLRSSAEAMRSQSFEIVAEQLDAAAAEIEGGLEAFGAVVDQKRAVEAELRALRSNHEHTLEFLARWRELIVAFQKEHPGDIRIKRALTGEHPMRAAVWEKVQ